MPKTHNPNYIYNLYILFLILGVKQACSSFLEKQLDATNCLGIKIFAEQHNCKELLQAADSFCLKHYEEIMKYDEFKMLPIDQVESLVQCDNLQVIISKNHKYNVIIYR